MRSSRRCTTRSPITRTGCSRDRAVGRAVGARRGIRRYSAVARRLRRRARIVARSAARLPPERAEPGVHDRLHGDADDACRAGLRRAVPELPDAIGWLQCGGMVQESRMSLHVVVTCADAAGTSTVAQRDAFVSLRLFAAPPYSAVGRPRRRRGRRAGDQAPGSRRRTKATSAARPPERRSTCAMRTRRSGLVRERGAARSRCRAAGRRAVDQRQRPAAAVNARSGQRFAELDDPLDFGEAARFVRVQRVDVLDLRV